MERVSTAGPGDGVANPADVENYHVDLGDELYTTRDGRSLVVMWHGNGYNRESCWLQIQEDDVLDLSDYE